MSLEGSTAKRGACRGHMLVPRVAPLLDVVSAAPGVFISHIPCPRGLRVSQLYMEMCLSVYVYLLLPTNLHIIIHCLTNSALPSGSDEQTWPLVTYRPLLFHPHACSDHDSGIKTTKLI